MILLAISILQVTTVLMLSMVVMNYQPLVTTASCCNCVGKTSVIDSKVAQMLDCIPNLYRTCLGEEVKCLRSSLLQPHFTNVIGNWDDINTFFTPQLNQIRATYLNSSLTPCPWEYVAEHDINRYPQYIHNVNCLQYNCENHYSMTDLVSCECKPVKYNTTVLERTAEQQWKTTNLTVNVACIPRFISDRGQ